METHFPNGRDFIRYEHSEKLVVDNKQAVANDAPMPEKPNMEPKKNRRGMRVFAWLRRVEINTENA